MGPPIYRWVGFGGGRARAEFGAIHLLVHRFSRGPDFEHEHEHEHEEQGTRNDEQARQKIALTVIPPFSLFKSCSCSAKRCSCSCSCSIAIHPKDCRVSLRRNVPPAFSSEKWGHPSIGGSVLEGAGCRARARARGTGNEGDEQARQKIALTAIPPFSLFKSCSCSAKRCSCSCSTTLKRNHIFVPQKMGPKMGRAQNGATHLLNRRISRRRISCSCSFPQ